MTKKKVIRIKEISIKEINELNHNRSVWVSKLIAQARMNESNIFTLYSNKRFISKKEQLYNEALKKLYRSILIYDDTYCRLRIRYVVALFKALKYPEKSFLIEEYEEASIKEPTKILK